MKNLSFFCFLALFIFFSACSNKQVVEPAFDGLQLRVVNNTKHDLVDTHANGLDFGTIEAHETTEYKELESMLETPGINANIRGIDYYGGYWCITGVPIVNKGTYTLYVEGLWDGNMLETLLEKEDVE